MDLVTLKTGAAMEAQLITQTFKHLNVKARVSPQDVRICGPSHISYGIELKPGTTVAQVNKCLPDLQVAIARARGRKAVGVRWQPPLQLEVDHPEPGALVYSGDLASFQPHCMLAGRDYLERPARDSIVDLAKSPHVLVAGTTGSGKSTIVRSMVSSLAVATPPSELVVYLIDLKNEDLLQFKRLPHVAEIATRQGHATRVIDEIVGIVQERVEGGSAKGLPRVLLVIDEFAQLGGPEVTDKLASVLALGRSKRVHVIAATQKPTIAVVGSLVRANFTTRFVGKVADSKEATTAAGRERTGAESLPGRGSFLRIDDDVRRIQAYYFDDQATEAAVDLAVERWRKVVTEPVTEPVMDAIVVEDWPVRAPEPQITGYDNRLEPVMPVLAVTARPTRELMPERHVPVKFPIGEARELTAFELAEVKRLRDSGMSLTLITKTVFGGKNGDRFDYIKRVLGEQGGAE